MQPGENVKQPKVLVPYNPLDKWNLGENVAEKLLAERLNDLPPRVRFRGAGVYALYYLGTLEFYARISGHERRREIQPIYIGKADPKGGRTGGAERDAPPGTELHDRLKDHGRSIAATSNLALKDFRCRFLVVEDIWIRLAERTLIQKFQPVWNVMVSGFGIHQPGGGRHGQKRSDWDVLHPGRSWTAQHKAQGKSLAQVTKSIEDFFKTHRPV